MLYRPSLTLASLACVCAPLAWSQDFNVLLQEGQFLATTIPPVTVDGIGSPWANTFGGWGVQIDSTDESGGSFDRIYADVGGIGFPTIIFSQGTYDGYVQGSFESTIGLTDLGDSVYSSSSTLGSTTGIDGVWINNMRVAIEGDPIPGLPGKVWRFASRPSAASGSGEPAFVGGINDAGGAVEGNALAIGNPPVVVLQSGDVLPGLPNPLETGSSVDFDFSVSPNGQHWINSVDTQSGSTANDFAMVIDGEALFIDGGLVAELSPLPASQQVDPAENWDSFDYFWILDDGTYFFSGDTDGPTATDEFILRDGEIVLREGDDAGAGLTWEGALESLAASTIGDLGFTWDVIASGTEAVGFNGRAVLIENQSIDLDDDGTPDGTIRGFNGMRGVAVSPLRKVYAVADVDTLGTSTTTDDLEVLVEIEIDDLEASTDSLSVSAGGTVDFTLFTRPDVDADFYLMAASLSGTAPGLPLGAGIVLPLNLDALFDLSLTGPDTPPFSGFFGAPDALGVGDASFTLPAGSSGALAGLTASFAYVSVGIAGGPVVTAASNAVDVALVP